LRPEKEITPVVDPPKLKQYIFPFGARIPPIKEVPVVVPTVV